jgi:hypothetical protein
MAETSLHRVLEGLSKVRLAIDLFESLGSRLKGKVTKKTKPKQQGLK